MMIMRGAADNSNFQTFPATWEFWLFSGCFYAPRTLLTIVSRKVFYFLVVGGIWGKPSNSNAFRVPTTPINADNCCRQIRQSDNFDGFIGLGADNSCRQIFDRRGIAMEAIERFSNLLQQAEGKLSVVEMVVLVRVVALRATLKPAF